MRLILIKENGKKCTIEFDRNIVDKIVHGCDEAQELSFIKVWHENYRPALQPIMDQIESFGYADLSDVICEYNPNLFVHYHDKIKNVCLRSLGYAAGKQPEIHEELTFKFAEDIMPIVDLDRSLVICNSECPYLYNNKCTKFNNDLLNLNNENIVCEPCFLHTTGDTLIQAYHKAFENMVNTYFDHSKNVIKD